MPVVLSWRWAGREGRRGRTLIDAGRRLAMCTYSTQDVSSARSMRMGTSRSKFVGPGYPSEAPFHASERGVAYGTRRWMNFGGSDFWNGHVAYLRHPRLQQEVYLVGSVHISKKSAEIVNEVILAVRPQAVMVELCEARKRAIVSIDQGQQTSTLDTILRMAGISRQQASAMVGDKILEFIDAYTRGNEMLVAMRAAEQVGAKVILGDRDQQTTLRRLKEEFNLSDVLKLLSTPMSPSSQSIFSTPFAKQKSEKEITRDDARRMLQRLRDSCSSGMISALVDERDEIMAQTLARCNFQRVVAVVGMAHMDGIEKRYKDEGLLIE
ncbi:hypothetical protein GUITHDRAFT_149884 [Guillardia theta CCMP2712]|uniref:TraB family protein n=1 Tax=Guillardia theta (strain CCMP2712) TaxID=905079 RepID=L1K338_GUITC|nr:hypothetical protein GUITHDRAFT_149884 [Guillardia theta CCMP2712]EKX54860.1 hypothetical protein GUITHDRAFT_149884 [Guillardia theta CCMP2712]|mmetsp:Transcript_34855/g.109018  ORF Transcript_34855/g.109018 Transcript_34855/m.109018 type:complete len:324 (-) Transcript_34855:44-1015(-)|eukprot:XP_005841840.1 hypothetical protein GUITHDRAFT_149884 [Guillardia theta CCMP2712]